MKSLVVASAAALAILVIPTAVNAQDTGGYVDFGDGTNPDPGNDFNSDCNYNPMCQAMIDASEDGAGNTEGADEGGGWLDSVKDGLKDIADWYEDPQKAEKEAAKKAEIERRQQEEERRIADLYAKFKENPEMVDAILQFKNQEDGLWQQAHRLLTDNRQFMFDGGGQSEDGTLTYSGFFNKGYIYGGYQLQENGSDEVYGGSFAGIATRIGRVTGTYITGQEKGNFTGSASADLKQVFSGGFSCTQNCAEDE